MKKDVIITGDLFCGAGGTSTGMADAIKDAGLHQIGFAINHWDVAVATMKKNHADIDTKMMRAESAEPTVLAPGRVINLLWASPSCTHHSRAKGGQPRQDQTRCQPHTIIPFLDQCKVYRIIVENVPESGCSDRMNSLPRIRFQSVTFSRGRKPNSSSKSGTRFP